MAKTTSGGGGGRGGQTVGRAGRRRGYRIGAVVTRRPATARAAARFLGAGRPISNLKSEISTVSDAGIILIATNDNQVAVAARTLARLKKNWRGPGGVEASGAPCARGAVPRPR